MGVYYSICYREGTKPDYLPDYNEKPTFDPQFGFEIPRKERELKISFEEMDALKIPPDRRDYCAHKLKDYYVCVKKNTPFLKFCRKEHHDLEHCEFEDYILRMKEYEREKRLRLRELKKKEKTIS